MTQRGRFALSGTGAACWVVAVVAYLLVLLTGDGWLLAVVAAGFVLPLVDLGFACAAGGLTLRRPSRAVAGGATPCRVERVGRGGWETDLVATVLAPSGAVRTRVHAGCDAAVLTFAAGGRGPMPALRWIADTYGPLGLAARRRHRCDDTPVLVHPAAAEPRAITLGGTLSGASREDSPQGAGHIPAGVRSFRPGDGARAVHWRSTARRGIPVVRERQAEQGRGLVVAAGRFGPADEPALAGAAATAVAALERGVPVTLLSSVGTVRPGGTGEALDWFALLTPGSAPVVPAGPVLWVGAAASAAPVAG